MKNNIATISAIIATLGAVLSLYASNAIAGLLEDHIQYMEQPEKVISCSARALMGYEWDNGENGCTFSSWVYIDYAKTEDAFEAMNCSENFSDICKDVSLCRYKDYPTDDYDFESECVAEKLFIKK